MSRFSRSGAVAEVTTPAATPARMASVNLMPPEIAEAARFRRIQLAMGGAVVAAAAIVGALYMHEHSGVASAQQDLATAQQQQTSLQGQLSQLASVQAVYSEVAAKQQLLQQAMGDEIRWSTYLTDLSLKMPDNVWLTNVTATPATGAGTPVTPATPGAAAVPAAPVASLAFTGVAFSHDDVATWLETLAKFKAFTNVYFTNSTEATIGPRKVFDFASTADLTAAGESGRYSKPAGS